MTESKMENFCYIVRIKDEFKNNLNLTTITKEFCGKFIRQLYGNLYFELNGSGALVIVPEEWIKLCAPSKVMWEHTRAKF